MKQRLYYLDSIKVFLTMLVISHHASLTYSVVSSWYIIDPNQNEISSLILILFTAVNQAYFMSFFFLISGYFTPVSYNRKGPLIFLKDRFIRLGIPLIIFYFFLSPLLIYISRIYNKGTDTSFFLFWIKNLASTAGPGPMWYVQALILFSLVYSIFRILSKNRRNSIIFPSNKIIFSFALALAAAAFIIRIVLPIDTEIIGFKLGYFPLYVLMYISGILAQQNKWLEIINTKKAKPWFIAALVLISLLPFIVILLGDTASFSGGFTLRSLIYAAWEPFVCFGLIMMLLVIFRRYANAPSVLGRELGRGAYAVYIFHPFFCVGAAILLMPLDLFPLIKFILCSGISIITAFIFAGFVVRIPLINRII